MQKHTLFMLNPWTEEDGQGPYYCPDCGIVEGFLYYSPELREKIDIVAVDFPRPRDMIVECIGMENQGSPVLVLADGNVDFEGVKQSMSTGRKFINDSLAICNFLGKTYNCILPHP